MNNPIIDYLLRALLISFFEQGFITLLGIRFLKAYDIIKNKKFKLVLTVLAVAMVSSLVNISGIPAILTPIIGACITLVSLMYLTKTNISKIIYASLFSILIFLITEYICINAIIYSTSLTANLIKANVRYAIPVSFFERIIQYTLTYVLYVRKKGRFLDATKVSIDVIDIIKSSKMHRRIAIAMISCNIAFILLMGKTFMFDKILVGIDPLQAVSVCLLSVLIPCLTLFGHFEVVFRSYSNNEIYINNIAKEVKNSADNAMKQALENGDPKVIEAIKKIYDVVDFS